MDAGVFGAAAATVASQLISGLLSLAVLLRRFRLCVPQKGEWAVKATLIVSADASEDDVYALTKAIFDNVDAIAVENGKGAELSIENATSGMTAPFHAGAAKYFAEKGVTVETN